jgi:hypothetical protein
MSTRHATPSVGSGIVAAIALALCGGAAYFVLAPLFGAPSAARDVVALLGLAYILYLFGTSRERVGRVTTIVVWLVAAAALWLGGVPFSVYVIVHVAMLSAVRALYFRSSLLTAAFDFGLGVLGIAFAAWAAARSGSAALAIWCFFLAQAFHVLVPAALHRAAAPSARFESQFERAHRNAEAALRRLSTGA